jgi:pimeloyl-ACP methyl ester carboxylesterase
VDLPGYGGSDSLDDYGSSDVLEALAEFIVGMREKYIDPSYRHSDEYGHKSQVYIVGHDWGCILSCRLAAEAPSLADRFILTNGPLVCSSAAWGGPVLRRQRSPR